MRGSDAYRSECIQALPTKEKTSKSLDQDLLEYSSAFDEWRNGFTYILSLDKRD